MLHIRFVIHGKVRWYRTGEFLVRAVSGKENTGSRFRKIRIVPHINADSTIGVLSKLHNITHNGIRILLHIDCTALKLRKIKLIHCNTA